MSKKSADSRTSGDQRWTEGLNPEQVDAVRHESGPLLILAGAGSGKTTVLVSRTGRLIDVVGRKASELLVVTFTNKAARELKARVAHRIGERAKGLVAGTFHSLGLSLMREFHRELDLNPGFGILDQEDSGGVVRDLLKETKSAVKDSFRVETILSCIHALRANDRATLIAAGDEYADLARVLLPKYIKSLSRLGVVDFESLILDPLRLLKERPEVCQRLNERFVDVMVDEFQDTNDSQFELVKLLAGPRQNLSVVGDDDQSIYGWRGAKISNILDFPKRFANCRVVRLERNYRSSPLILDLANTIIAKNEKRHGKVLKTSAKQVKSPTKPELFAYETDEIEAEEIVSQIRHFQREDYRYADIAVLYRSNGQGGLIEAQLRRNQIPYTITGGTGLFERREIKDVLAYIRLSLSPNELAFRRVMNTPPRGLGDAAIEKIEVGAKRLGVRLHVAARKWRELGVQEAAGEGLDLFFSWLDALPDQILHNPTDSAGDALLGELARIGYRDFLFNQSAKPEVGQKKWELVGILGRVLNGFIQRGGREISTLEEFLTALELRDQGEEPSSADAASPEAQGSVQLLTLHASKGLEFPVVLIVGCEEDLIPHKLLGQDVAEERRLFYVGVTRAKERLVLTRALTRRRHGRQQPVSITRFLADLPDQLLCRFETGFRPVDEVSRQSMVSDLMAKLAAKAQEKRLEK